ncbi:MAG: hypothetical protein AB7N76_13095 [Planctomycetota bacterium]
MKCAPHGVTLCWVVALCLLATSPARAGGLLDTRIQLSPALPAERPLTSEGYAPPSELPSLSFRIRLGVWEGFVRGSLQTPRGGRPGSTSQRRPTVTEIGMGAPTAAPVVDFAATFFGRHDLRLRARLLQLRGHARLGEELISQGARFPGGTEVSAGLDLQRFRIGYRPRWLDLELRGWRLLPEVGVMFSTLRYTLRARDGPAPPEEARVDRGYSYLAPYLGISASRELLPGLDLELELSASAFVNGVTDLEAEARLVWTPLVIGQTRISFEVGVQAGWYRRKDGQPLEQNDPNLLVGGLVLGVRFDF